MKLSSVPTKLKNSTAVEAASAIAHGPPAKPQWSIDAHCICRSPPRAQASYPHSFVFSIIHLKGHRYLLFLWVLYGTRPSSMHKTHVRFSISRPSQFSMAQTVHPSPVQSGRCGTGFVHDCVCRDERRSLTAYWPLSMVQYVLLSVWSSVQERRYICGPFSAGATTRTVCASLCTSM